MTTTEDEQTGKRVRSLLIWPGMASLSLWAVGLIIAGIQFVSLSATARAASDGARIPGLFLGMPLFTGFHDQGRFGVHPEWGLLALLIVPAAVGIVMTLVMLRDLPHRG